MFFDSFYEEDLMVTRMMSIFALYNVNKHSMPRHWLLRKNKKGFPSTHAWEPLYLKGKAKNAQTHKRTKFILTTVVKHGGGSPFICYKYLSSPSGL